MPDAETPNTEPTPEQIVEAVYRYAAEQLHNGTEPAVVVQNLIEQGLSAENAAAVIRNLQEAQSKADSEAASKNMLFGALWCIGGIIVTAITYNAAQGEGGGKYIIAWGAILFGGIQFLYGLIQFAKK